MSWRQFLLWSSLIVGISIAVKLADYAVNLKEIRKVEGMTIQELKAYIKTPEQFRWYEGHCLDLRVSFDLKSPERTHMDSAGDCGDKSLQAYYCLQDDGYANTFLQIYKIGVLHQLLYYKIYLRGIDGLHERYGILGDMDPIMYGSLEEIARAKGGVGFRVSRFNANAVPNWVTTKESIDVKKAWGPLTDYISLD